MAVDPRGRDAGSPAVKGRCSICKVKHSVDRQGLLKAHANPQNYFCRGSGSVPEVPPGKGKRIVHDDRRASPPAELDDDLTDL